MRKIGVGAILVRDNRILLGQRLSNAHYGSWGIAGGGQEDGETPEEALVREVKEETGLTVVKFQRAEYDPSLFTTQEYLDANYQRESIFFEVLEFKGEPITGEPHKCAGWNWFDWLNLPSPLMLPVQRLFASGFVPSQIRK